MVLILTGGIAFADGATPMQQGMELFYQGKFADSMPFFDQARQADPQNVLALNYLLYAAYKTLAIPTVQQKIEAEAVAKDKDPQVQADLGIVYWFRSQSDNSMSEEAVNQFKSALQIDPNCAPAQCGMALTYYEKRMMPRAKGHFLKAVENNPHDLMALERLGEILMVDEKKPDMAADVFGRITQQAPYYPDGHYYLGSSLYDQKKFDDSLVELKKCMDLDPKGITQGYYAMALAGDIYRERKDTANAIKMYQAALAARPDSEYVRVQLDKVQNPQNPQTAASPEKKGK
ncbi:MAG: tetratricopeptide repeat protein [Candidatus Xenobia bacterium]